MKRWICLLLALLTLPAVGMAANMPIQLPFAENATLRVAVYDNYYAAASYAEPLPVLEWIEQRTGVQIEWDVTPPSQYDEVMRVRLAAGTDLPDIVQIPSSYSNKSTVLTYAMGGLIIPLEDLFAEYAPNMMQLIYEDEPYLGKNFTALDGHVYHIAQNFTGGNMVEVKGLILRTDWLDILGLEKPETIDEWYEVMKAFKEGDPNGNGLADEVGATSFNGLGEYGYFATAFGLAAPATKYIEVDGKAVNQYNESGFKDFLMFLNKLYSEGIMDPQYKTGDEAKLDAMGAKDILGVSAHFGTKAELWGSTAALAGNPNSASAAYELVLSPADENGNVRMISRDPCGFAYSVTRDCKDPVLAVKWLDYIYASDEGRDVMLYGVEGTTYETNASGGRVWMDWILHNKDGLSTGAALRSVGAFPAQFSNRTVAFYEMMVSPAVAQAGALLRQYMIQPFPQVMGTEEETDRIASLNADIGTYEEEMIQKFVMGQASFGEFDKFLATVQSMGGDELDQIKQAQLDRYNAVE
ncbi:MAG TPA: extracellular solute-binding protein [Clostridia bacterium]|nr:extracellular solute-binding protein [Clostridia bacterium]